MSAPLRTAAALPSDEQLLLLRAATLEGDVAREAAAAWQARTRPETLDLESARLLPLLYDNLRRLGAKGPALDRYASVYRRTWVKNRLLFARTAEVVQAFERAGIATLVLKGAALALLHYRTPAARAMEDVDLLVPAARAQEALARLAALGFAAGASEREVAPALRHSLNFVHGNGGKLDLHWYVSAEARHPGDDEELWRAAVPLLLEGTPTRALDATHQLFHVLAHAYASAARHLRWIADARVLLTGASIDWTRFMALARTRRLVLPVAAALAWLRENLHAPVPASVLAALAGSRIAVVDRLEHASHTAQRPYTAAKILLRMWCDHRRSSALAGPALVGAFPDYLKVYYGVGTRRRLVSTGLRRALGRVRRSGIL
jgi:hypothetical protein